MRFLRCRAVFLRLGIGVSPFKKIPVLYSSRINVCDETTWTWNCRD
jgi:hypothetical protein